MEKKYIVRLSDEEREVLQSIVKKLKSSSQQVRRAHGLLMADVNGPAWTDQMISNTYGGGVKSIENLRKKLVLEGFEAALNRKKRVTPPCPKILDGEQEAKVIAMRLGKPPAGYSNWALRLLADQVVSLEIAPSISYETIRRTLKKTV